MNNCKCIKFWGPSVGANKFMGTVKDSISQIWFRVFLLYFLEKIFPFGFTGKSLLIHCQENLPINVKQLKYLYKHPPCMTNLILTNLWNITLFHVSEDNNNLFWPSSCLESLTSYVSPFSGYWALVAGRAGRQARNLSSVANRDLWSAPYALKLLPPCD